MILPFFLLSCNTKYKSTIKVCDNKLFVEQFNNKYVDVAYDYLTDSTNFRIYIGKFDNEHAYYRYNCEDDSVVISETYEEKVISIRKYSLIDLRKAKEGF
jgi:hypothetical protein